MRAAESSSSPSSWSIFFLSFFLSKPLNWIHAQLRFRFKLSKRLTVWSLRPSLYTRTLELYNYSQDSTQAKKISSFKIPHIKIDLLLLLPRGQNFFSYYMYNTL
jgi:hypothetical protein